MQKRRPTRLFKLQTNLKAIKHQKIIEISVRGRGEGGGLLCPFLKIEKKSLAFGEKNTMSVFICWLNSSFKDVKEKKTPFSCGAFLSCDEDEMLIEVPLFQETSSALKNCQLRPWYKGLHKFLNKNKHFYTKQFDFRNIHSFIYSHSFIHYHLVVNCGFCNQFYHSFVF